MFRNNMIYGQKEEDAVDFLIKQYKKKLLKSSLERMSKNGLIWREKLSDDEHSKLKNYKMAGAIYRHVFSTIGSCSGDLLKLAEANYTRVIGLAMYSLSVSEREFYNYFTALRFFGTHATSVRNVETKNPKLIKENTAKLRLESWKTLKTKGLGLKNKFLAQREISEGVLGNDDFVFLSLECGNVKSKSYSRFGNKLYRIPVDSNSSFSHSFITLNNLLTSKNQPKFTLDKLTASDETKRKIVRNYNVKDIIAIGDIKKFVCCSLILFIRQLSEIDKESLLGIRNEYDINILINSVFRPQVCIPRRLYARQDTYEVRDLK
ncbi:hypothetical protein DVH07_18480 [Hafnia paralvei]|uniref:hypothetical protein n=1 Tax=Hafnia paralvei TaxID=546367 RepID=UPI000DF489E5|nr:hypothetical protein [Hafnia paralvei]RDA61928.1 hypothetical protein DU449_18040 [Hafnia paralvei]RDA62988.1 hypothetical protein DVH08_20250 [Hafnia paralvei]RDA63828.1 hypothetical protein DVH09_18610 [Hafnia paralvei]RDA75114.1 hypothetical protein DVH10_17780 [Hafnia paralvei]RDA75519.1 hypothetical protein DVH07_18480 [Hafnia paralvei]